MRFSKALVCGVAILFSALGAAQETQKEPVPREEFTAYWRGVYRYPQDASSPVKFNLVMVQQGTLLAGYSREPNTFGTLGEPWLHAIIKGEIDKQTGALTFTKIYDGTAGQRHAVNYQGTAAQGGSAVAGNWSIANSVGGEFTLVKTPATQSGALSGLWTGTYHYPEGNGQAPVRFNMIILHDRHGVMGSIKETNTFGNPDQPWLTARLKGSFNAKTGKLTFVKTYDGTGGEEHDVDYAAALSQDRKTLDGTWTLDDALSGRFTAERLPLNEKTLNDLR